MFEEFRRPAVGLGVGDSVAGIAALPGETAGCGCAEAIVVGAEAITAAPNAGAAGRPTTTVAVAVLVAAGLVEVARAASWGDDVSRS